MYNVSAEMLANVSVLKDFLLYRDKPELYSDLLNMDDITRFSTGLCTIGCPKKTTFEMSGSHPLKCFLMESYYTM